MAKKKTQEEFIAQAIEIHGNKYDYSKVNYINGRTKVCIICPIHGEFWVTPEAHLQGYQCKQCSVEVRAEKRRFTKEKFIEDAVATHGDKYDYSKVDYKNANTKVLIICKTCGNEFWQTPAKHVRGDGCRECAFKNSRKLIHGVGINDYDGHVKINGEHIASYACWLHVLKRCYSEKSLIKHPAYLGCSVSDEWRYFSKFKAWFDENYIEGYEIDKDLLVHGNKVYSKDTCCFIPQELNKALIRQNNKRGEYPIGVYFKKSSNKYVAQINTMYKLSRWVGAYDTFEEAFNAYKIAKEEYLKRLADDYYSKELITRKVYDALYNYRVEITD